MDRAALAGRTGVALGLLSAGALLSSGPGYRLGLWDLHPAFTLLRWAAYGALGGGALLLLALLLGRRAGVAWSWLAALLACAIVAWIPWHQLQIAQRVPPIHDVSTDPEHPLAFLAVLPLRAAAKNPVAYGGPEIAAQQRRAYPDLQPLLLPLTVDDAYARALQIARERGWEIVASDPAQARIEATATTFWFGFRDDVVVQVTAAPAGARVDARSLSRVGQSDLGANAARLRAYLAALRSL